VATSIQCIKKTSKAGGYNGLFQRIKTLKIDLIFAGLASICGIGGSFLRGGNSMDPFWGFCTLLWLLLFFGGAMVPSFTGIMISAVALKRYNLLCYYIIQHSFLHIISILKKILIHTKSNRPNGFSLVL